jgi:hypothetical protein
MARKGTPKRPHKRTSSKGKTFSAGRGASKTRHGQQADAFNNVKHYALLGNARFTTYWYRKWSKLEVDGNIRDEMNMLHDDLIYAIRTGNYSAVHEALKRMEGLA